MPIPNDEFDVPMPEDPSDYIPPEMAGGGGDQQPPDEPPAAQATPAGGGPRRNQGNRAQPTARAQQIFKTNSKWNRGLMGGFSAMATEAVRGVENSWLGSAQMLDASGAVTSRASQAVGTRFVNEDTGEVTVSGQMAAKASSLVGDAWENAVGGPLPDSPKALLKTVETTCARLPAQLYRQLG